MFRVICENNRRSIYERVEAFKPVKGENQYGFYKKSGKWYGCHSSEIINKLPLNMNQYWRLGNLLIKKVR